MDTDQLLNKRGIQCSTIAIFVRTILTIPCILMSTRQVARHPKRRTLKNEVQIVEIPGNAPSNQEKISVSLFLKITINCSFKHFTTEPGYDYYDVIQR